MITWSNNSVLFYALRAEELVQVMDMMPGHPCSCIEGDRGHIDNRSSCRAWVQHLQDVHQANILVWWPWRWLGWVDLHHASSGLSQFWWSLATSFNHWKQSIERFKLLADGTPLSTKISTWMDDNEYHAENREKTIFMKRYEKDFMMHGIIC